jgi:tetratricopeptide (TPR) repeat protein
MGMLRRCQGRWAESQIELERALELDPNTLGAAGQLGITVLAQGKPDAAMPHFERAILAQARHRNLFNLYINLGRCHLFSGRIGEAVELLRRGRMLAPGMWYGPLELAGALGLVGTIEEAKSEIVEAVTLKPEVDSIARWRALAVLQGWGHPQFQALREKTIYTGLRAAGFPEE